MLVVSDQVHTEVRILPPNLQIRRLVALDASTGNTERMIEMLRDLARRERQGKITTGPRADRRPLRDGIVGPASDGSWRRTNPTAQAPAPALLSTDGSSSASSGPNPFFDSRRL
jgi:hypothetical protein